MSKKLIKKCQPGDIIVKSDNTRVSSPVVQEKPIYIQPQLKQTYVSADYRSPWQQQQDQKKAEIAYNMYMDEKNKELALQHALGLAAVADAVMLVPDVTDLITKGIRYAGKKHLQKKATKALTEVLDNGTPIVDDIIDARIINYTPTTSKVKSSPYLGMLERPSTLSDAELKGVTKHDRNRVVRTNPLAGVDSNVDTYLINRSNTPIEFVDGTSVWFPGGSRAGKERATVHFTTDRPVIGHAFGDWSTSSETLLTPYAQVVKDNGLPLNIEPMDTYFSQLYPFIIRQDGTKIFTSNPHNYRRYKALGVDAYTDKEAQQLWQQIHDLQIEENLLKDKLGSEIFIPGTKAWDEAADLRRRMDQAAQRHNDIHVNWAKQHNTVDLDTYGQMEAETGLKSGVRTRRREWYEHTDAPPVLQYSTTPPTHSVSWFMDWNSPQQRYNTFLQYLKEYPDIITDQDVQMFQRLLQTNPDLMKQYLQHIKFKSGGRLISKHAKGNPVNTNPLPERPINTNPIPKKEDKKKKKLFEIDQRVVGNIPPQYLTFPKGKGKGLYMIKRNE